MARRLKKRRLPKSRDMLLVRRKSLPKDVREIVDRITKIRRERGKFVALSTLGAVAGTATAVASIVGAGPEESRAVLAAVGAGVDLGAIPGFQIAIRKDHLVEALHDRLSRVLKMHPNIMRMLGGKHAFIRVNKRGIYGTDKPGNRFSRARIMIDTGRAINLGVLDDYTRLERRRQKIIGSPKTQHDVLKQKWRHQ